MRIISQTLLVCSTLWVASHAFSLQPVARQHLSGLTITTPSPRNPRSLMLLDSSTSAVAEATETATSSSSSNKNITQLSIYAKIGITEDQLGMGINPDEVLEWIGTREVMIEKVMRDIKKFDRAQAEKEVDKYLMDPEAVNFHIEFQKRLAENPYMIQPVEEEGFFSFRTLVIAYVTYVGGEVLYRNFLHDYIDLSFVPGWGPLPVKEEVVDAVQNTVAAASFAMDAIGSSM